MIEDKIKNAHKIIERALSISKKPFVAYSGGKDGLIVAHMISKYYVPNIKMVCETSHTFDSVISDIKEISNLYNFNVDYINSLSDDWLLRHPEYLFTSDFKLIAKYCFRRQQTTIKKYQKKNGYDLTFTGRTKWDNTVKAEIYSTKNNGLQAHPIRDFTEKDVWEYFRKENVRVPMIYNTKFGKKTGNSPFYAMGYKNKGLPISKCWEAVNELDVEKKYYNKFHKHTIRDFA